MLLKKKDFSVASLSLSHFIFHHHHFVYCDYCFVFVGHAKRGLKKPCSKWSKIKILITNEKSSQDCDFCLRRRMFLVESESEFVFFFFVWSDSIKVSRAFQLNEFCFSGKNCTIIIQKLKRLHHFKMLNEKKMCFFFLQKRFYLNQEEERTVRT